MSNIKKALRKTGRLESLSREILIEKGVIREPNVRNPIPHGQCTIRESVAAVIVPENYKRYARKPLDLPLAMGIGGKNRDALEFIGGGLDSEEEKRIKEAHVRGERVDADFLDAQGNIPQYLYFLAQGKYMLETGNLAQYTYDTREGVRVILKRELKRQMEEETGIETEGMVTLHDVFDAPPNVTHLLSARFGPFTEEIAKKYEGLRLNDKGMLEGVMITIEERGVLATADIDALVRMARETEEVREMVSITVGELLERGEKATKSVEAWDTYGKGKPRNNSVFYLVRALLEHMRKVA